MRPASAAARASLSSLRGRKGRYVHWEGDSVSEEKREVHGDGVIVLTIEGNSCLKKETHSKRVYGGRNL